MSNNGCMRPSVLIGTLLISWMNKECACIQQLRGSENWCPVHSAAGAEKRAIVQRVIRDLNAQELEGARP